MPPIGRQHGLDCICHQCELRDEAARKEEMHRRAEAFPELLTMLHCARDWLIEYKADFGDQIKLGDLKTLNVVLIDMGELLRRLS